MPIWFELIVMLLVAYAIGFAIGWLAWGRKATPRDEYEEGDSE